MFRKLDRKTSFFLLGVVLFFGVGYLAICIKNEILGNWIFPLLFLLSSANRLTALFRKEDGAQTDAGFRRWRAINLLILLPCSFCIILLMVLGLCLQRLDLVLWAYPVGFVELIALEIVKLSHKHKAKKKAPSASPDPETPGK